MNTTTHTRCRVCGSDDLRLLIDYGQMPLAGGFLMSGNGRVSETFPLQLVRCSSCTLMQILDAVPPEKIFSQYSYASSTTRTLTEHFERMARELIAAGEAEGKLVVEFGCNDGVLLRPLISGGAKVVGIDPSDIALRASREQGWPLVNDYFNKGVAEEVRERYGPARIVTGNNVFAHMDNIHEVVRGVTTLLEDDGLFVFEVHYQGDLINLVQFDTVYHEHVCYHSLSSLSHLLTTHRLKVVDVLRIPIHAGSVRVTAARENSPREPEQVVEQMLLAEKSWDVDGFVRQVSTRRETLRKLVGDLRRAGRRVVAYGAAGRVTILLNYCGLGKDMVEYVIDMSPLRHGRFVPGVMTPIVPPETFQSTWPDYAIMTAWNYEAEIISKEQDFLEGGGRFIIPLPEVRVVGAQ